MRVRRAASRSYWTFLVVAVILSAAVTYSAMSIVSISDAGMVSSLQLQNAVAFLQAENAQLRQQLAATASATGTPLGLDPVAIYAQDSASVVTLDGLQASAAGSSEVLGSGFVASLQNSYYVITNFHVVQNVTDLTTTFQDGNAYPAEVLGTDPYSDLAVVSANAPQSEFHPLHVVGSSGLKVGQPIVAIGNPFGLSGSMTFGIISHLGRTISESLAGAFPIANAIQFSAPINPGNSGGPLLSANGTVVGITTASVQSAQGVGFAIPSDTILKELPSLITNGKYLGHSYLGIGTDDMNFQLAKLQGTNVTYGALIESVNPGSPAAKAGLRAGNSPTQVQGNQYNIGGDIIIGINGTKIVNTDALSSYLQEFTVPDQSVVLQIIRAGHVMTVNLVLGTRPPAPSG